jgi:putative acyl-CoA dehydrogenase
MAKRSPIEARREAAVPRFAAGGTHEVTNQPPPLVGHDACADPALLAALDREGAGWHRGALRRLGRLAGSEQALRWAEQADRNPPELRTHDRYGHRIDEVDFHPAWHRLLDVAVGAGLAGAPWADARPGAHVARAADMLVWGTVEQGHLCPVSMTYAAVPVLRAAPALATRYEPLLTSRVYDPGLRVPDGKAGLLVGMGMTEKQGGSDVRTNTTTAAPSADGTYRLRGHKWFTSAPMNDAFLVLAQAPEGLSCFWVPRVLPGGERNTFRLQRLKDKLGNRSNASAEPEFDDTVAWLVGQPGRGVRTIIDMVALTRLDAALASAAGMRAALTTAVHHVRHRRAFGSLLIDAPLMRVVVADLAVETEAATTLVMRIAGAVDRAVGGDPGERSLRRIATAIAKYWVCKRAPGVIVEALECLGGNGYVEESGMPRLYREAPLNGIWEGSGNVNALDVLRALGREPDAVDALSTEIEAARGGDTRLDRAWDDLRTRLATAADDPGGARRVVERLALVLQGSLLVRHAPPAVADAFCATRIAGDGGLAFGTLPAGIDIPGILDRIASVGTAPDSVGDIRHEIDQHRNSS